MIQRRMHELEKHVEGFVGHELNRVVIIAIIGFGLRLFQLGAGLWEKHSWRQADMAMISSNFYRNGFDILHPQVNWAGNMPGYVGTEFPLVPFLTALLYLLFGEHLFVGRLVSIGFFALSIPLFYLLVRRYFGQQAACWALCFYVISPLSVFYTRNLMPESAMLCFSIGALYFFSSWMDDDRNRNYSLAILFTTLALLVKIPMAITGVPLGYLAFTKHRWAMFRQKKLWVFAFAALVPSFLWYHHAFSLAVNNYPFHMFGEGLWIWDGGYQALFQPRVYVKIILQMSAFLLTPVGLLMAVGGVFLTSREEKVSHLFHWWGAGLFFYLIVGLRGYYRHEYYQLAFVPVAAAFAGVFGAYLSGFLHRTQSAYRAYYKIGFVGALSAIILVPAIALLTLKYYSQPELTLYHAGKSLDGKIPKNSLIVAWDGNNPTLIYASKQRGWHFRGGKEFQQSVPYLEDLRRKGAGYFVAPINPRPNRDKLPFIRFVEASVNERVSGFSENDSDKYIGGLRLFDPDSEFGVYLANRYRKIFDDQFILVYDLRPEKLD